MVEAEGNSVINFKKYLHVCCKLLNFHTIQLFCSLALVLLSNQKSQGNCIFFLSYGVDRISMPASD